MKNFYLKILAKAAVFFMSTSKSVIIQVVELFLVSLTIHFLRIRKVNWLVRCKRNVIVLCMVILGCSPPVTTLAAWYQTDGWYFLNPVQDENYGKALIGWQWIDGYCYYFQNDGKMLAGTITPDGFMVNGEGAWVVDGQPWYVEGKGIITKPMRAIAHAGGGPSGGGGGGGGNQSRPVKPKDPVPEVPEASVPEKPEIPKDSVVATPPDAFKEYLYTILYKDIETKEILHISTGQEREDEIIYLEHPDIANYEICEGQKDRFKLVNDQMTISVYYRKIPEASPSDAVKVDWNIYFVEQGNHANEIFKMQSGRSVEGTELLIDFPEVVVGKDGYHYKALEESPCSILLYGTGRQKYYIEFEKKQMSDKPSPDPYEAARVKLNYWLELSRKADQELTGIVSLDGKLITENLDESNRRLKNLFSMAADTGRHEVYLIAKNHVPSSFILGQLPDAGSISEMTMDEHLRIGEDEYIILKVGFKKSFYEKNCAHNLRVSDDVNPGCLFNGSQMISCVKCGYEISVVALARGHQDVVGDGICDICYKMMVDHEVPEATYFQLGDIQARKIGNKIYLFRCIDEDYEDSLNNNQKSALFLCDQVVRSDIDSTSGNHETMIFGGNNNYKTSSLREWLQKNARDSLSATHKSYIGISLAYTGATEKGSFEQFDDTGLVAREKTFQLLEDNIFCLSVEEAIKYKEFLWKFNGADRNNPESQYSAYSKGYWLRTPQFGEVNGQFVYGMGIYAVDLVNGNIHVLDVKNQSIGIRPVISVVQG